MKRQYAYIPDTYYKTMWKQLRAMLEGLDDVQLQAFRVATMMDEMEDVPEQEAKQKLVNSGILNES